MHFTNPQLKWLKLKVSSSQFCHIYFLQNCRSCYNHLQLSVKIAMTRWEKRKKKKRNRIMQLSRLKFHHIYNSRTCEIRSGAAQTGLNLFLKNDNVDMSGTKKSHLKASFHRPTRVGGPNSIRFGNLVNSICQVLNISCRYTSHAEKGTGIT